MRYIIEGGKKLKGEITVSGNKNSVFPCVAAALLTSEEVVLENVPQIHDSEVLVKILREIGVNVLWEKDMLTISTKDLNWKLPQDLMIKLRGSIVLIGAILAREGKVQFYHPGGDVIGKRTIEPHLEGFKSLGAKVGGKDLIYSIFYPNGKRAIQDFRIFLKEFSVTGTENLILASVLGKGVVTIRKCAEEPHVVDLCRMLLQMGAQIAGIGTNTLIISGVEKLSGTRFVLSGDCIEVGTYGIAAAITGGEITVSGILGLDLDPILYPLSGFGLSFEQKANEIIFTQSKLKSMPKLEVNIWPGFPTDLMSPAIVLATQARGVTLCHDWMYESRMFFVDKLIAMGANITIADPHRVVVYGPSFLKGRELETPDIRAGMALVLASLVAKGRSIIYRAELIERGYEDVVEKLNKLGADIKKLQQ